MEYRISILEGQIDLLKKQREWDKAELRGEIRSAQKRWTRYEWLIEGMTYVAALTGGGLFGYFLLGPLFACIH